MRIAPVHDLKELIDKGEKLLVIDIRDPEDFEFCHIKDSVNFPSPEFMQRIPEIPKDIPVFLVCKYGKKSEQLVTVLKEDHGYRNVKSLLGGLWEWSREIDKTMIVW